MALGLNKKVAEQQQNAKPIVLANDNISLWRDLDGMSLVELDALGDKWELHSLEVATSTNDIPALLLEFKDKFVAFPFSKGIGGDPADAKAFMKETDSAYGKFYIRRKRKLDPQGQVLPGEDLTPTGAEMIFFGKPSGIVYKERELIYSAESVPAGN